ncbi:hypothetical protein [Candidatus Cytomitobacter primus]|uniref:Uncharacterized protein n=1 Tax=Candidatus Cytomitobacter primus TaxID=2066024 RepID=A0A5C0UFY9_9PROT|nr:hypothetical protein [Candidatus Cytomitobacter primus]QEK38591.1 hypothetical protein FZC34_01550 [Candidatus Cytomitobacter primus]
MKKNYIAILCILGSCASVESNPGPSRAQLAKGQNTNARKQQNADRTVVDRLAASASSMLQSGIESTQHLAQGALNAGRNLPSQGYNAAHSAAQYGYSTAQRGYSAAKDLPGKYLPTPENRKKLMDIYNLLNSLYTAFNAFYNKTPNSFNEVNYEVSLDNLIKIKGLAYSVYSGIDALQKAYASSQSLYNG